MKGIRTDVWTKEEREVELGYEIKISDSDSEFLKGKYMVHIVEGGVTGYESFIIENGNINKMAIHGWRACNGTFIGDYGRWDRLEINASEMKKVLEAYEEIITKGNLDGHYTDHVA